VATRTRCNQRQDAATRAVRRCIENSERVARQRGFWASLPRRYRRDRAWVTPCCSMEGNFSRGDRQVCQWKCAPSGALNQRRAVRPKLSPELGQPPAGDGAKSALQRSNFARACHVSCLQAEIAALVTFARVPRRRLETPAPHQGAVAKQIDRLNETPMPPVGRERMRGKRQNRVREPAADARPLILPPYGICACRFA
jgi:hypothetical protein